MPTHFIKNLAHTSMERSGFKVEKNKQNDGCSCEHLNGVKCDVTNCHYHDKDCFCTAGHIEIGPHRAFSSADTVCSTFKPD